MKVKVSSVLHGNYTFTLYNVFIDKLHWLSGNYRASAACYERAIQLEPDAVEHHEVFMDDRVLYVSHGLFLRVCCAVSCNKAS